MEKLKNNMVLYLLLLIAFYIIPLFIKDTASAMTLLRKILIKDHDFSLNFIKSLSKKLYETEKLLEILSIKDSYNRLGAFLLYRAGLTNDGYMSQSREYCS